VVGPEIPLAAGIVDAFQLEGLPVFGPTRAAAQIEVSKSFAKTIMRKMNIPTGHAKRCSDLVSALGALGEFKPPYVIKADGLAQGKGVVIAPTRDEAEAAIKDMMQARVFGAAGDLVLIEEHLSGEEVSIFGISDGRHVVAMEPAQDHKRVFDQDQGPNTGGMGAYSPVPHLPAKLVEEVRSRVLQPAVEGMAEQGTPFRGLLYAGLIMTADGIKVIEFNCRFGDPETQVILPRLADDLLRVMLESVGTGSRRSALTFVPEAAVSVVAASGGYPGEYKTGLPIEGLDEAENTGALVFHAGTKADGGKVLTAGGRVLNITGRGADLKAAAAQAYAAVEKISFPGMHVRRDIAARALNRANAKEV
jgi:phosphoribosylamine--glycine ligase